MKKKNDLVIIVNNRTKIMGFAALFILIFHVWILVFDKVNELSFLEKYIRGIGFCGVDIFLLLSGMGLVSSIKKGIKVFYFNRFKRLFFTYILTSFMAFFIYKWNIIQFIQNVFFYNFFTSSIYSYLWFVPTIIIFYLLFPLYFKFFDSSKNKNIFLILSMCFWFVIAFLLKNYINEDIYGIINRIPIFLTGIWLGWFIESKNYKMSKFFLIFNISMLIIGLQLAYLTNFKDIYILLPQSYYLINYLIALPLTILLAKIFNCISNLKYIENFYEFCGTISFQLYCIQELLFFVIVSFLLSLNIPVFLVNIIYIIILLFIAKLILVLDKKISEKM